MSDTESATFEYADAAGYPDGTGLLDEGTAVVVDEVTKEIARAIDNPSAETDAEIAVRHLPGEHRFAAMLGGREIATIRYQEQNGRLWILSTHVDPRFRGRGIATEFIADVLDDLSQAGIKVEVLCPGVNAFLERNSSYADLVAAN